jgi:2,3-bisphosphoglycerate-dependent phosphoglycerate mutase
VGYGSVMPALGADRWPSSLWLVRHGESSGNVARDLAEAGGQQMIDIATRDMDVPLSELGMDQARALHERVLTLSPDACPTIAISSPYVRAEQTARLALGDDAELLLDERLREREFGILDRLTRAGIEHKFPEQAAARAFLGKFWHRPPGGESWADVALRLRSFLDTLGREHAGERVLVVTHQVVIMVFRYLLEQLREAEVLAIGRAADVANCSVTVYELDPDAGKNGRMRLTRFNDVAHLQRAGEPVTAEPDVQAGPR